MKAKAENDVKTNAEAIKRLKMEHAAILQNYELAKTEIGKLLSGYADDWQANTDATCKKLEEDSREYTAHQKQLSDDTAKRNQVYSRDWMQASTLEVVFSSHDVHRI